VHPPAPSLSLRAARTSDRQKRGRRIVHRSLTLFSGPCAVSCYAFASRGGCRPLGEGKSPMKAIRKLSRRSFFATVAGGAATVAIVVVAGPEVALAQSGCSDSDSGPNGDPGGNGRRCAPARRRTGCTDRDGGRYADGVGYGRRCNTRRRTGITDRDSGQNSDPANYGRGRRNRSCTDSDTGRNSDPAGRGRHC
jgi:hypothetical protein